MHKKIKGELTIVGAGPGDPELITLKGINAVEQADVILYDALVNKEILIHNTKGKHFFVGKRKGAHSFKQHEINQMLVNFILDGKDVVRLKGGDVSVFARAAEEIDYALKHNIEATLIPGISSFTGIAAAHRIPLTRRCQYESIWVTTGYTCDGRPSPDIEFAAQSTATIAILMGMTHLEEIMRLFSTHKPKNYPVAVVQNGTLPTERWVLGTIENIAKKVSDAGINNPATIFVGPAVTDSTTRWQLQREVQLA
jgi:uroporphyrin-III C-methyltransferase